MENNESGNIKNLAKLAKNRLKKGFWEDYNTQVKNGVENAKEDGKCTSNVINYYKTLAVREIKNNDDSKEEFYQKVKRILDEEGEVSNMIARLCDEERLKGMNFSDRQRYIFDISAEYRECKIRYDEEKKYGNFSEIKQVK